jgi:hypothetical protein
VILAVALCSFEGPRRNFLGLSPFSGGYCEGETPLPIPNRAVKPLSADGTWLARAWESRTPPVYLQRRVACGRPFVVCVKPPQPVAYDDYDELPKVAELSLSGSAPASSVPGPRPRLRRAQIYLLGAQ